MLFMKKLIFAKSKGTHGPRKEAPTSPAPRRRVSPWLAGLALVELVVTVAAISAVAVTGVAVVNHVQSSASDVKLESDVMEINNAIRIYRTAGGSLENVSDPQEVLNKLKTVATKENSHDREIMFVKGSVIDLRLRTVGMDESWRGGSKYARYNLAEQKFEVVPVAGEDGFKGFTLDDAAVYSAEEYRKVVFKQSKSDEWVWDHGEVADNTPQDVPFDAASEEAKVQEYSTTSNAGLPTANPPVISPGLPQSQLSVYPLTATITDPNEAGTTRLYYKIGGGEFKPYTTPLPVAPGTTIAAFAASTNSEKLYDSATVSNLYVPDPVIPSLQDTLPASVTYFAMGGQAATGSSTPSATAFSISLQNGDQIPAHYETSDNFRVEISVGNRSFQTPAFTGQYPGDVIPLLLSDFSGSGVASVSYRAKALNEQLFASSPVVSKTVQASVLNLPAPLLTMSSNQVSIAVNLAAGSVPKDFRIYYRIGADPGNAAGEPQSGATLYTSPVSMPSGGGTLYARVYPPSNYKTWFNTSPVSSLEVQGEEEENFGDYMGYYNVIVFNNLWTPNALEGKSWTGGTWTSGNSFSMSQNYTPSGPENVTVVGGSTGYGNHVHLNGGINSKLAVTNNSVIVRPFNWNGGGNQSNRVVIDPDIPAKTQAMRTQLRALSAELAQQSSNSSLVVSGNNRTFECKPNAQGVAIFNISPSSFFEAQNASGDIKMANGYNFSSLKGVLINVSGTSLNTSSSVNLNGNLRNDQWTSKIIWNFSSATSMNMAAQWVGGSLLAPKASVTSQNGFTGNVVCENLNAATVWRKTFDAKAVLDLAD